MTAGPGDERAAIVAGRGHLRTSHADREHVIGKLKLAFVQGRLTKDELDARVGRAFASRTYAELAALTADLPPGLVPAPARRPGRPQPPSPASKVVAGAVLILPAPAAVLAALLSGNDIVGKIAVLALFVYFMAWVAAGAQLISNWHDNRSRRRLPPSGAQSRRGLEGEQSAGSGDGLMLSEIAESRPDGSFFFRCAVP